MYTLFPFLKNHIVNKTEFKYGILVLYINGFLLCFFIFKNLKPALQYLYVLLTTKFLILKEI